MGSYLARAVSDLLAHGLDAEDLALLMMIPAEHVARVAAGEELPSLNGPTADRLGVAIELLEDLKKSQLDPERRRYLLWADIYLIMLDEALGR